MHRENAAFKAGKELKMKIALVGEMRNLDQCATEEYGISENLLMENAGQAMYSVIASECGKVEGKSFAVFCGTGNNGGDGLVIARKLLSNGGKVKIFFPDGEPQLKGATQKNYAIAARLPIEMSRISSGNDLNIALRDCDVAVDALFGTGLARQVEGIYRETIQAINKCGKPVFSVDIPSGINGNTGEVMGTAVKANYTVAFGLPKTGNMLFPGYEYCGKLYVSRISFPPQLYNNASLKIQVNAPVKLQERKRDTHKGDFGEVLFIAGARSYLGAPYFSALSFLKAGGGYSHLAAPSSICPFLSSGGREVVFLPQEETAEGSIALKNKEALLQIARKMDMVVIGPGLSLDNETQKLVRELAGEIESPLLIDGDGITAISHNPEIIKERKADTILTPHPGEMARLTGLPAGEIKGKSIEVLQKASAELNAIIDLKGAHSLIGYPDGNVFVNLSGNSGMATAGSGDVLAGTIAAAFGLGLGSREATRTGVFLHGLAGDLAADDRGEDGITAQDIMNYLPLAMKHYRQNFEKIEENLYESLFMI